jgi:hypothetical protein
MRLALVDLNESKGGGDLPDTRQTVQARSATSTQPRGPEGLNPLRSRLGAAAYERLVSALALCTGFEALLVLRDIRGLSPGEAIKVSQWMAHVCRSVGSGQFERFE